MEKMPGYADFLPPRSRCVVEFGCGAGELGHRFKQFQPACYYVGVDVDADRLKAAAGVLDQTALQDFASFGLAEHGIRAVDCLVYHGWFLQQYSLQQQLRQQVSVLSDEGQVVFFMDNPGYFRRLSALWQGRSVRGDGLQLILPDLVRLLESCGLTLHRVLPQYDVEDKALRESPELQQLVQLWEKLQGKTHGDLWATGWVVCAAKVAATRPRFLIQTMIGEKMACARVRVQDPDQFSRTLFGVDTESRVYAADLGRGRGYGQKVMIRQRIKTNGLKGLKDIAAILQQGYALVYEIDDNPLFWRSKAEKCDYAEYRCCHAIQVSTPALAEQMRQFNPNVVVFQNQLTYLPESRSYEDDGLVTIFFGALNRQKDWQEIMPELNKVLRKYKGRVRVQVMFDREFFDALATTNRELIGAEYPYGFAPYEVYEAALHRADIALLPLRRTEFNVMKSDLKFIESAGHGAVVLASPTVYEDSVCDGRTGFLYRSPKEFREKLTMLIEDRELRVGTARAAYAYVRDERLLAQHYEERMAFYRTLLPQLKKRTPELLAQLHEIQLHVAEKQPENN